MPRQRLSHSLGHRADQAGVVVAAAQVPLSFQRTLMPRPTVDQALVTGLSMATNHALASLVQESIQATALVLLRQHRGRRPHDPTWSRATLALDVGVVAAGFAVQRALRRRHREPLTRATARTGGLWLSITGTAATAIGLLQEVSSRRSRRGRRTIPAVVPTAGATAIAGEILRRRAARLDANLTPDPQKISPPEALGLGSAVAVAVSALGLGERALADAVARGVGRVVPGNRELFRPLGHAVALAVLGGATRTLVERTFHRIEGRETSIEAAFDIPPVNPLVSGSRESHVDFATLSKQGRRFAWTVNTADTIRELLDEADAHSPIRVYVGLESADTEEARVRLVLDELERTEAFTREWILVASPTGTGYTNYAAVSALEVLSRGNCATIAMQYAARPSVLSLGQVKEGRRQTGLLLQALHQRVSKMQPQARPKLLLFGESLGAWTSQDPFVDRGTAGLRDRGIDHAIWIGTPEFSKWKEQVLNDDRPDLDRALVGVFNGIDEWRALDADARARLRYVMITHYNDGVARFGAPIAVQEPEWLGPPERRPPTIPKGMRWAPTTTFFQVLVDMKNSANVVPGKFAATGHDYRADLLPFFHAVLGFDADQAQLDRIEAWLERDELARSQWIKAHGAAGRSLAVAVVEEALGRSDGGGAEMQRLIRGVAERELRAGGGASGEHPSAPPAD